MKKVPDIRVKGFCEDWERCKLGNIFEEYSEKNHADLPPLTIIQGGGTVRRDESERNISYDKASLSNYKMVNEGDFIVHLRSFEGGLEIATTVGIISPAYHTFHGEETDSRFYYSYFRSRNFIHIDLKPHVYGIRDGKSISIAGMKTIEIPHPNLEEQQVIGDYIQHMDTLINFYQRKSEKLKLFKESMLDKMFPKNGEKVPEIRLEGFSGDWEKRKLGEIVQITMGQSPDGSTYSDTPSDYILVQGNADLRNGWVVPRVWTTQSTKRTYAGDIIMSVRAPAGAVGKTSYNAVIGRGVAAIKGNEFIYQTLVKMDLEGYWKKLSAGSTFESLSSDSISNSEIFVPTAKEQEQIGVYFQTIDTLISFHQRKLEKLKQFKKSMLNKMFI